MEKFSKITKVKISSIKDDINSINNDPNIAIRYSLHTLIKRLLHIKSNGSVDPMLQGDLKIEGEEEFISAIIDLFKDKEIQEQVKLLENSKYIGIDNMINSINTTILDKQTILEIRSHRKRIKELIKESIVSGENIIDLATKQVNNINDIDKIYNRILVIEKMLETENISKKKLNDILLIYSKKFNNIKNNG